MISRWDVDVEVLREDVVVELFNTCCDDLDTEEFVVDELSKFCLVVIPFVDGLFLLKFSISDAISGGVLLAIIVAVDSGTSDISLLLLSRRQDGLSVIFIMFTSSYYFFNVLLLFYPLTAFLRNYNTRLEHDNFF